MPSTPGSGLETLGRTKQFFASLAYQSLWDEGPATWPGHHDQARRLVLGQLVSLSFLPQLERPDGGRYDGQFRHDKAHGVGRRLTLQILEELAPCIWPWHCEGFAMPTEMSIADSGSRTRQSWALTAVFAPPLLLRPMGMASLFMRMDPPTKATGRWTASQIDKLE